MRIAAHNTIRRPLANFAEDKSGSVAMMFSISIFGVLMLIGAAFDYGRIIHARQKLGAAVDAATIAAAKRLQDTSANKADLEAFASTFFNENIKTSGTFAKILNFKVDVDNATNAVTTTVASQVDTTFTRIAGITSVSVPASSTAIFNSQDIEVGLQLDVTGSMGSYISGKRKIDSLKEATTDLINILLPDGSSGSTKVRIGLAPFDAGVNAGAYASKVTGKTTDTCTYERTDAYYDSTDEYPSGTSRLKARSDISGAYNCPSSAKIVPLTTDKSTLSTMVSKLSPGSSTAGHLGTAWAWYLISPKWNSIWPTDSQPAAYNDKKTRKIAILMTDGIYNTVGGINLGDGNPASKTKAKATCAAMRAQGIVIYSVGFLRPTGDEDAEATLRDCAGTGGTFYKAEDGEQLKTAFKNIAQDISRLRLTQ